MSDALFSIFPDENYVDLTLYQFGYEKCTPLHSFGPYRRNHYLFHYILSGKGSLFCEHQPHVSTEYRLEAGSGFLIEPGMINTYRADRSCPWEYAWIEFDGLRVKSFLNQAGLSGTSPIYTPTSPEGSRLIQEELLYLASHGDAEPAHLIGHLYLFMDLLITHSSSRKKTQKGKITEFYAREALSYIEQHYANNLTVEDLAAICNLDRSYFGKIFKEIMGQSPQEFLIHYRMARAAEQLSGTALSIGEIGRNVGYQNQLHFSRAFKSVYGIAPREYRQEHRIIK